MKLKSGITLIGLPGSGKSTLGVQLAKSRAQDFLDTDIELQKQIDAPLQVYLDQFGIDALKLAESNCICNLAPQNCVVATGGSAVYSADAMAHLGQFGSIVYLEISYATMMERLGDCADRGIAADLSEGLQPMFEERVGLYRRYAQIVVDANPSVPQVLQSLNKLL